jgi:plastocyanin
MAKYQADPKDVANLLALADEFYAAELWTEATGWIDKVIELEPENTRALLAKGAVAFNSGDTATAETTWKKVVTLDPKNQEAYYDLGFLYLNQSTPDWVGVQREWNKVIELDPTTALAQSVQSHLDSLAAASMMPTASDEPGASPAASPAAAAPTGTVVPVAAKDLAYNTSALAAPADEPFTIRFANNDDGLPHDVQIKDASGATVFAGDLVTGPATVDYQVPALKAGTYTFLCSIHPTMTGTLTVGS